MKKSHRIGLSALTIALLLSVVSCTSSGNGTGTEASTSGVTDPATGTGAVGETPTELLTETPNGVPTAPENETDIEQVKEEPLVFDQLSDLDQLTAPFWRMNVMYNESTTMIVREDGTITAKLLFKPTKIRSVLSNDLKTEYVEGKDYTWDGESNTLVWLEGSAIKYFTQNDIEGRDENGNQLPDFNGSFDELGRSRFGNALYCVSAFLYEKQIAVTYEYEYGAWDGPVTEYQGDRLPKTMEKLANGEELRVVFWGDSIFTGCDSSKMYNREPQQESFPDFTKEILEAKYESHIKRYNPSVGGKDSIWGVSEVQQVIDKEPDLVFIGFGMNDGDKSGRSVARNIENMMKKIREQYPDCEFVVVACMVPNAEAGFLTTHSSFPEAFAKLAGEGVAFVDMFSFHAKILETKDFISTSGNNINHPNDWLIRVYTMNLMSALLEYE